MVGARRKASAGYIAVYPSALENSLARVYRDYARDLNRFTRDQLDPILPRLTAQAYAHRFDLADYDPADDEDDDQADKSSYYALLALALSRILAYGRRRASALTSAIRRHGDQINAANAREAKKAVAHAFGTDVHAAAKWAAKAQQKLLGRGPDGHSGHGAAGASPYPVGPHSGAPGGVNQQVNIGGALSPRHPHETQAEANARIRAAITTNLFNEPDAAILEELRAFEAENLRLVRSIPQQHVEKLRGQIVAALRGKKTVAEIVKIIRDNSDVTERRAILIARSQVGLLNGQLNMLRQTAMGVTSFTWRGMMDSRERPTHVAREGAIGTWSDGVGGIWPGSEINCRCWASPVWTDE